jgi:hypothetical protein
MCLHFHPSITTHPTKGTIERTERSSAGWFSCGETYLLGLKSLTWHECSHFPRFILEFNDAILSVVGDMAVNSEAPVVTSSISIFTGPTQFFGGAHRGRLLWLRQSRYLVAQLNSSEVLIRVECACVHFPVQLSSLVVRVCMHAFIEVSMCSSMWVSASITWSRKKGCYWQLI